jgi:hypothetical protein
MTIKTKPDKGWSTGTAMDCPYCKKTIGIDARTFKAAKQLQKLKGYSNKECSAIKCPSERHWILLEPWKMEARK